MRRIGTLYIVISLLMALFAVTASIIGDDASYYAGCAGLALTMLCGLLDR